MERLGPGTWFCLEALADEFYDDPETFANLALIIFKRIPCQVCCRDSLLYLQHNPISQPKKWVCRFHNYVNAKLGKKQWTCDRNADKPVLRVRSAQV